MSVLSLGLLEDEEESLSNYLRCLCITKIVYSSECEILLILRNLGYF